ncbi:hypothetical protein WN55_03769 [Dufourea novaeangliae]|uniref:CCHC-type domain-containing protein n=2 Tax=Dufourea novaeangliae TaxID=178035 RepID=A0A154PK83_DUFNO|nr:hypothetical protein WN55_03769 [Dufourea novaeangliae]
MTIKDKTTIVQSSRSCYNCLQTGHQVKNCTRRHCSRCGRKHHSLLHRDDFHSEKELDKIPNVQNTDVTLTSVTNIASKLDAYTVLSTAIVQIMDSKGKRLECRALLDSGS